MGTVWKLLEQIMLPGLIISGGAHAQISCQRMRDQTKKVNEQTEKIKQQYDNIITGVQEINADLIADIQETYDNIKQLSDQIEVSHNEYKQAYRNIQIGGIFLVSLIFLLLVLKEYGLLSVIWELIKWPFLQIANLFSKSSKGAK